MKKILTGLIALIISGAVFAGSVSIEGAKLNTIGGNDQTNSNFTLSEAVNKTISVHTQLSSTQTDKTNSVSTRLEVGGTATAPLFGSVTGYTKIALGQKFSTSGSGQFAYYSIEPGILVPLTSNLSTKIAYRYRTAMDNPNVNKDTTDTVRVGVTYAINKKDAVGFRFDRITGDSRQDGYNVFYTRSF
jgi:predicted porin